MGDLPDVLVREAEQLRDTGTDTAYAGRLFDLGNACKIHCWNQRSDESRDYSKPTQLVNLNIPHGSKGGGAPPVAVAVLQARKALGLTQRQLAEALKVSQGNVAKWESAKLTPPGQVFAALAKLVPDSERDYWLKLAGLGCAQLPGHDDDARHVPLLKDAAAAGTPRALEEGEIDSVIPFPKSWLPRGGKLYAVRIAGDSMSPILNDGYVVLIDTTQRDPKKLVEKMVAAREGDGVTIKWLRYADGVYMLQPQHSSSRHQVRVMKSETDHSIVGAVVMWIGQPVPVKR